LTPRDNYINETGEDIIPSDKPLEETTCSQFRWIVPAKKKISLYLKFYSKIPGQFDSLLDFECFYSIRKYQVPLTGICDYPSINANPMNVFM
jgi:hypothetical protein